ncbi:DNA topoisomerase IB [Luteolibacter flavescens]|uniref:DNA topoisomerase n=1 Tax=Luteolibacter flavescens TaxID=1859460 RepID=A0ABT3FQU4_9BACT|nr:DNA topoisomerase IB [Luteolibacter flavescens]MCW1885948.1 DNA topoisomerase IB [Luteolibacter flavescens]
MADDTAVAVGTSWRKHLDRTFETVEGEGLTIDGDFDAPLVLVAAAFAGFHGGSPFAACVPPSQKLVRRLRRRAIMAGLIFTHDGMPGYRRGRAGRGFSYHLPEGTLLRDKLERSRIASLAVPPAYEGVWICMAENGHLQATGLDQRGRKQYRYHPEWHRLAGDRKFMHLTDFAKALPSIRRRVRAALDGDSLDRDRIIAGIVTLLDQTGFRIGNHRYVRENRSFGLASLLTRHVRETDEGLQLRFRGKAGKEHRTRIDDARVSALVEELQELPGQYLFCHRVGRRWRPIESGDVNDWLKEISGGDFTAKQFRTWRATVTCARELGRMPPPESKTAIRRAENVAIRTTAERLNHTPATCRSYYIHPAIFRAFRKGDLHGRMQARPPLLRKSDGSAFLRADERRVLSVIEAHERPPKRPKGARRPKLECIVREGTKQPQRPRK